MNTVKLVVLSTELREIPKKDKSTGQVLPGQVHLFQKVRLHTADGQIQEFEEYIRDRQSAIAVGEYEQNIAGLTVDRNGRLAFRANLQRRMQPQQSDAVSSIVNPSRKAG